MAFLRCEQAYVFLNYLDDYKHKYKDRNCTSFLYSDYVYES